MVVVEEISVVSIEEALERETNAEAVVTGVEEAVEAGRAGTWRAGNNGETSLSPGA